MNPIPIRIGIKITNKRIDKGIRTPKYFLMPGSLFLIAIILNTIPNKSVAIVKMKMTIVITFPIGCGISVENM
jgi:hypothetical protein